METDYRQKRLTLARIAEAEGQLTLRGNENMAGAAIEKYLAVFREAMNRNAGTTEYSDPSVGYRWCAAFVYYCCLQAGFTFPPKPIPGRGWTLAAAPAWYQWAILPENDFYFPHDDPRRTPEPGDIILFNRLMEDKDLDHVGIVVGVSPEALTTAEGNFHNRSRIFQRRRDRSVHGYVRLNRY